MYLEKSVKRLFHNLLNEQENEAVITIVQKIKLPLPGKLTTLCYYSSTLRDLKALEPGMPCYTVVSVCSVLGLCLLLHVISYYKN